MAAVWLYFTSRGDRNPIRSVRLAVDTWAMNNEAHRTTEIPSVRWDYLSGAFHVGWTVPGVSEALEAFGDMDDEEWTYSERVDYLLTACLTSH